MVAIFSAAGAAGGSCPPRPAEPPPARCGPATTCFSHTRYVIGRVAMAFDPELAERLRAVLATAVPVPPTEKKMMGGLSFMVRGKMCCGVMGEDLLVRVGAAEARRALAEPETRPFDMGRGPSADWLLIAPAGVGTDKALGNWVRKALVFVATLPDK